MWRMSKPKREWKEEYSTNGFWGSQRPFSGSEFVLEIQHSEDIVDIPETELIEEILDLMMGISSGNIKVSNTYKTKSYRKGTILLLSKHPTISLSPSIEIGRGIIERMCGYFDQTGEKTEEKQNDEFFESIFSWVDIWDLCQQLSSFGHKVSELKQIPDQSIDTPQKETKKNRLEIGRKMKSLSLTGQALSSALRYHLDQYFLLIANLEESLRSDNKSSSLTLQSLWYSILPSTRVLYLLQKFCKYIRSEVENINGQNSNSDDHVADSKHKALLSHGCFILNSLYKHYIELSGDEESRKVFFDLLQKTTKPIFTMLEKWIYLGLLDDPYNEFFITRSFPSQSKITDNNSSNNNNNNNNSNFSEKEINWEDQFYLQRQNIPDFLAFHSLPEKILATGKYLFILRNSTSASNIVSSLSNSQSPFCFSENLSNLEEQVNQAHFYASKKLLELLHSEQLLPKLRCFKRYYLLERCDFFTSFLETAQVELVKPCPELNMEVLNSLLILAINSSSYRSSYMDYQHSNPTHNSINFHNNNNNNNSNNIIHIDTPNEAMDVDRPISNHDTEEEEGGVAIFVETLNYSLITHADWLHRKNDTSLPPAENARSLNGEECFTFGWKELKNKAKRETVFEKLTPSSSRESFLATSEHPSSENEFFSISKNTENAPHVLPVNLGMSENTGKRIGIRMIVGPTETKQYQLLLRFRSILYLNSVRLSHARLRIHKLHSSVKEIRNIIFPANKILFHKINFIQNINYYICYDVIQPNWQKMENQLHCISTFEDAILHHKNFLTFTITQCLLDNMLLLRIILKMLSICTLFATYLCQFCQLMPENYFPKDKPKESKDDGEEEKEEMSKDAKKFQNELKIFPQNVKKFSEAFNSSSKTLLNSLRSLPSIDHQLASLIIRLSNSLPTA